MKKYKAILFDFDGTLAKTMEDNFEAWKHVLKEYNIELKSDEYYPLEGFNPKNLAEYFASKHTGINCNLLEIIDKKETYYRFHNSFSLYHKVDEIITEFFKNEIPMAIVTSGQMRRLVETASMNFLDKFDVIITADDQCKGKPFPDPYLKAAEKLNINPTDCIVIENSPLGIQSAKSAGMVCIAITSTLDYSYLKGADRIVGKFHDILNINVIKEMLDARKN